MRARRRTIGIAAFIAVLAAWPIVLYVAGKHSPDMVPALAAAALAFIIGCAIVLRSWAIGGIVIARCIGALLRQDGFEVFMLMIAGFSIGASIDPKAKGATLPCQTRKTVIQTRTRIR
jgi:hypothetical protein